MIRRLPAHPDEERCPFLPGDVYQRKLRGVAGRPSFRVIGEPAWQTLADVSLRDAQAEGFGGRRALEAFRLDWVRRHDGWAARHPTASDERVLERWRMVTQHQNCWVVTLALLEPPRLLPTQRNVLTEVSRRGAERSSGRLARDGSEYTTGQTIDREVEAVDEATLTRIVAGELGARAERITSRRERRAVRRRRLFDDVS